MACKCVICETPVRGYYGYKCDICGLNATVFVAYAHTPVRGYCPRCAEDLDIFDPRPDIDVSFKDYEKRGFKY